MLKHVNGTKGKLHVHFLVHTCVKTKECHTRANKGQGFYIKYYSSPPQWYILPIFLIRDRIKLSKMYLYKLIF